MDQLASAARLIRFGVFELDLRTGELRKSGLKLRLHGQPVEVLKVLLERPGELVTREELEKRLWVGDTVVEFEHSINAAVNRLREALGDSADNPRFIETLARRGYRFIYPVDVGAHGGAPPVAPVSAPAADVGAGLALPSGAQQAAPLQKRWRLALAAMGIVGVLAALLALNVVGLRDRILRTVGAVREPPLRIDSIAVLPLENLSGDKEQEYFADGMTEELITSLGKIGSLRVISRTSVMRFKGARPAGGLAEIAQKLNVDAVVEGSVMRSGDRVRITANLIHAPSDRHLWAESYDRDLRDVLALQGEIARAVADEVKAKLTPQEQTRLARSRPVNLEAHRLYMLGRFHWNKRTEEGLKNAIDHFQRTIQIDPAYAPAYAGLADSYDVLGDHGYLPPKEAFPKAKVAAQKALDIDESLAAAHASLAFAYYVYDWNWGASEKEFKRAIELNPSYATAHQWYSIYLSNMRRHADAVAEAQRAQQLDPLSAIITANVGYSYFTARNYQEAIGRFRDAVSLFSDFPVAYSMLARTYMANGMYQEAIITYQKAGSLFGANPAQVAALGQAYAKRGIRGYYLWQLQRLREESKHRYVSAADFAYVFAGLGEKDEAFSYLEKAYEDRDCYLTRLQVLPALDPLRSDPRFQDLLRRMNFPP